MKRIMNLDELWMGIWFSAAITKWWCMVVSTIVIARALFGKVFLGVVE